MPADYDFDDFLIKQCQRVERYLKRITRRSRIDGRQRRSAILQEFSCYNVGGSIASTSAMGPRKMTLSEIERDECAIGTRREAFKKLL